MLAEKPRLASADRASAPQQLVAGLRWIGRVGDRHAADVVGEGDARPRLLDGQPAKPLLDLGDDLGAFGVGELELG